MRTNQGTLERALRVLAGAAALAVGYLYGGLPAYGSYTLMVAGVVLIATGLVAYCPAWHILGISTKGQGGRQPQTGG